MTRKHFFGLGIIATGIVAAISLAVPASSIAQSGVPECSPRTLPKAEKTAMESEYARRVEKDGQASADAWLEGEARSFLARLVDQGICRMPDSKEREVAANSPPAAEKPVRGKDGQPCRHTRVEHRNVASVNGGPMQMIMVTVCAD
jgi:hypothetical protein